MKVFLPVLVAVIAACYATEVEENAPKQWALLVAGSNGWENYRHQADISHAYQLLRRRGVPASNIIVMMYDDIARNSLNPRKNVLINKPNGPNVYKGVKIDYKGNDVTPANFLAVLAGNKAAVKGKGTGRVIQSGPKDNVFVNFADHGGSGILCFPNDDLNAADLLKTLKQLTTEKKYGKLVLYIEACEAGSNFDNLLPEHTNIFVSTASAPDESSWGWYCDGPLPCLGDLYSINWMEHLDKKIAANESLFDQYQEIRTKTLPTPSSQTGSHVNLYGDLSLGLRGTKEFVGPHNIAAEDDNTATDASEFVGVPSRDVALHYYKQMAKHGSNHLEKIKYAEMASELEKKREFVDNVVDKIIEKVAEKDEDIINEITNKYQAFTEESLECHVRVYKHFSKKCFNLNKNQYVLKHFYKFANICHLGSYFEENAFEAIDAICNDDFPVITNTL